MQTNQTPAASESRHTPEPQPATDSPTWPYVLAFAHRMEAKLVKNRHKGDRAGWMKDHPWELVERMLEETVEVQQCFTARPEDMDCPDPEKTADECADVANFCMMVADRVQPFAGVAAPEKELKRLREVECQYVFSRQEYDALESKIRTTEDANTLLIQACDKAHERLRTTEADNAILREALLKCVAICEENITAEAAAVTRPRWIIDALATGAGAVLLEELDELRISECMNSEYARAHEQRADAAEEALREIILAIDPENDISDSEGTSPNEVLEIVKAELDILQRKVAAAEEVISLVAEHPCDTALKAALAAWKEANK